MDEGRLRVIAYLGFLCIYTSYLMIPKTDYLSPKITSFQSLEYHTDLKDQAGNQNFHNDKHKEATKKVRGWCIQILLAITISNTYTSSTSRDSIHSQGRENLKRPMQHDEQLLLDT